MKQNSENSPAENTKNCLPSLGFAPPPQMKHVHVQPPVPSYFEAQVRELISKLSIEVLLYQQMLV